MKLYNSIGPNPRLVRMFAAEKGLTLPLVEVDIIEKKKDYSVGRIAEILEPSPDRQVPVCVAGCCQWQHIRYDRQVDYKESIIRESLTRLGHIEWNGNINRVTGPDRNYRLRATFHVADGKFGYMEEKSHTIIPIRECASHLLWYAHG